MNARTSRAFGALAGLAMLIGTGCGGEAPASRAVTVDTLPSGVVHVRSAADGLWAGGSPWRVELRARIGSVEGEGPDAFAFVVGLAADPFGRLWVLDRQAKGLRVFTPEGRHVRTVGREGGGPGEFRDPGSVSLAPDGRLWVVDWGNQRISVFDTTGALVADHGRRVAGYGWAWRGGFDPEGNFVDFLLDLPRQEARLPRFALDMQPVDTLPAPASPVSGEVFEARYADGGQRMMAVPHTPRPSWSFAPGGGFWLAEGASFRLVRLSADLDTLRVAEREYRPVPLAAVERRAAEEQVRQFLGEEARVDLDRIPREKPAVLWIAVDELGYVWVRPGRPADAPPALDVFDPDGRYLGPVALPFDVAGDPLRITADRIYAVHTSELGVPFVVVLDLDRGADA